MVVWASLQTLFIPKQIHNFGWLNSMQLFQNLGNNGSKRLTFKHKQQFWILLQQLNRLKNVLSIVKLMLLIAKHLDTTLALSLVRQLTTVSKMALWKPILLVTLKTGMSLIQFTAIFTWNYSLRNSTVVSGQRPKERKDLKKRSLLKSAGTKNYISMDQRVILTLLIIDLKIKQSKDTVSSKQEYQL